MNKRILFVLTAAAVTLPVGIFAAYRTSAAPHAAAQTVRAASPVPDLPPTTGAPVVVDAANAFLSTLSQQQQTAAQIALTPDNAARWSNFPAGVVPRNGVYFRDLTAGQAEAALKVARLALSPEGFARFQEIRATDNYFGKHDTGPGGRGPGGPGGQNLFGEGNYIIAFLGKPSTTTPWLLQLGGHHIAFNIYYKGTAGASTPYFIGVQPNTWKDASGKTHTPLAPMRDAMHGLVNSLTPEQLTKARLDASFSDVYVGPGRDGQFPASEGVPVSQLSDASKKLAKQAIAAWTGDTAQAAEYRKRYYDELDRTKVAYSGTTALSGEGDYVRIDGPHVWIEFCCQASDHYHTIWRDRVSDYGAEFSF